MQLSISEVGEFDDEVGVSVMFADSGEGELRTVPLNIGNRFHLIYELSETGHSITVSGLPGDSSDEQASLLDEVSGFIRETLASEEFVSALRGRNGD